MTRKGRIMEFVIRQPETKNTEQGEVREVWFEKDDNGYARLCVKNPQTGVKDVVAALYPAGEVRALGSKELNIRAE